VADRAGPDQGLDDSGAERAGAAGNDNMTIAKVQEIAPCEQTTSSLKHYSTTSA
jgi:hypothetical protein